MDDVEFHQLGREMLGMLREVCLSDPATMSARTGLADAEEAFEALERLLDPRADAVNPAYRDMHLATAALFVIGADQSAYLEMMVGLDWSGDDWNLATVAGAWNEDDQGCVLLDVEAAELREWRSAHPRPFEQEYAPILAEAFAWASRGLLPDHQHSIST